MPGEDKKHVAHRALVDRVLHGAGKAAAADRDRAFRNTDVPLPIRVLIDKVATKPAEIGDPDFTTAKTAGLSEDEIFELVVCAAVGRSAQMYEAGLAALAAATTKEGE
ncbi:hypothetical protein [Nocardia brasiliensis]|uniref:hypothetical protein n=1 Tax=Nocardia brasiliensis TaxID=37326 RepID=UPI003D943D2D